MSDEQQGDGSAVERAGSSGAGDRSDLMSELEIIESQPLSGRAEAYEALHDALARRLESDPAGGVRP